MKKLFLSASLLLISFLIVAQNQPVAVNDTAIAMSEQTVAISVLLNDYDPDGDEIEIKNARSPEHGEIDYDETTVYYTPDLYIGVDSLKYRIIEVDDPFSVSEYAWIYITVNENPNIPVAVDDEESVLLLAPTELDILENDSDPNGDEFVICNIRKTNGYFDLELSEDSLSVIVTAEYPLAQDSVAFKYRIKEKNAQTNYYSDWAIVNITINANPDIPITVDDEESVLQLVPTELDILENFSDIVHY